MTCPFSVRNVENCAVSNTEYSSEKYYAKFPGIDRERTERVGVIQRRLPGKVGEAGEGAIPCQEEL